MHELGTAKFWHGNMVLSKYFHRNMPTFLLFCCFLSIFLSLFLIGSTTTKFPVFSHYSAGLSYYFGEGE